MMMTGGNVTLEVEEAR